MAKITKLDLKVKGQYVSFPINVSADGIFYTKLPDDVAQFNGRDRIEAETKQALETVIKNLVADYNASQTTVKKVVIMMIDVDEDFYIGNRGIFSPQRVAIQAGVFEKVTVGNNSSYNCVHPSKFPSHLRLNKYFDAERNKRVIEYEWSEDVELGVMDTLIQFHALCAMYADLEAVSQIVEGEENMVDVFNRFYTLADEEFSPEFEDREDEDE